MTPSISPEYSPTPTTGPPPVPLAPGFRFHPTDEELVSYYLRRRINGRRLRLDAIAEVDFYRLEPWDLPPKSRIRSRDAQWYFFARLDRKLSGAGAGGRGNNGGFGRTNRGTPNGYWKTTGKDRDVVHKGKIVGLKKTLVFHSGRAPKGQRTNWVMHEYRLLDVAAEADKDMYVVCRLFQKNGSGPQNGAQYGASFVEEEWEEEDEMEMGSGGDLGQVTVAMLAGDADGEDLDEEVDEMGFFQMNRITKNEDLVNPPEIAPFPAQGGDENYPENLTFSMEDIMQLPASDGSSVENADKHGEQTYNNSEVSIADWSCYASQNGHVGQDYLADPMKLNGLTNGGSTHWPLRSNSNQEPVNGVEGGINLQEILNVEEFFDSANENNALPEQPTMQANDMVAPSIGVHPGDKTEENIFYDASTQNWVNGKDDFVNLNDLLYLPIPSPSMLNLEDDLMAYFDATENDIKYDFGSVDKLENYDPQVTDASTVIQKIEDANGFAFNGPQKMQDANAMSGASSSVMPPEDLHSAGSKAKDFAGMSDDIVDKKTFGKRFVSMLGSIPAPAALAADYPVPMGKSMPSMSPSTSSIRITAGMIQIDGLTFTGNTEHWPFQKNGDVDFQHFYTMPGGVSTKSVDIDPATLMLRGGFYFVFVSTMILALSYKIGLCIYGR